MRLLKICAIPKADEQAFLDTVATYFRSSDADDSAAMVRARRQAEAVVKRLPEFPQAYLLLVKILMDLDDYDACHGALQTVIGLCKGELMEGNCPEAVNALAEAHLLYGRIAIEKGARDSAFCFFQTTIDSPDGVDPGLIEEAYANMASLYSEGGELRMANYYIQAGIAHLERLGATEYCLLAGEQELVWQVMN